MMLLFHLFGEKTGGGFHQLELQIPHLGPAFFGHDDNCTNRIPLRNDGSDNLRSYFTVTIA